MFIAHSTNSFLVIYDISTPKRLQKVAKIMQDYGVRVQKSVFEIVVSEHSLTQMKQRIYGIIDTEKDGVKIFPLCERCCSRKYGVGRDTQEHKFFSQPRWAIF